MFVTWTTKPDVSPAFSLTVIGDATSALLTFPPRASSSLFAFANTLSLKSVVCVNIPLTNINPKDNKTTPITIIMIVFIDNSKAPFLFIHFTSYYFPLVDINLLILQIYIPILWKFLIDKYQA